MERLDVATRVALIRCYYSREKSATAALRMLRSEQKATSHVCDESTVRRLVSKFEISGSVLDLPRSGRTKISEVEVEKVKEAVEELQGSSA